MNNRAAPACGACALPDPAALERRTATVARLRRTLVLAAGYMVAEAAAGWLTNSLALLADAGHMLSDVVALGISLAALHAASWPRTAARTFGWHRAEALAAMVNAAALAVVAASICVEAAGRLGSPPEVEGRVAFVVATGGLLVNLSGLAILGRDHDHGLGVRGAWIHLLGDALGSAGAMASAAAVSLYGWNWADPLASLLIAVLIVRSAWALMGETLDVLMEAAPRRLDVPALGEALGALPGVAGVHDLHVWTITSGMDALSGHLVLAHGANGREVLATAREMLHDRFDIHHVTLQPEDQAGEAPACDGAPEPREGDHAQGIS